jgi:glycosyltransferase involved in cell wall biosynthesis
MRFLLVNYEYPPVGAGAATASQAIARALVGLGHDAAVITGKYKGLPATAQDDGVTVHRVPSFRRALDHSGLFEMASFVLSAMVTVPTVVRRHKIQAIITFFSLPCGPIGLFAHWRCGIPYLVSLRGGDVPGTEPSLQSMQRLLTPLRRAVLKNSVAIVANSDGLRKMAEAADPFPVRVIPNGIDTQLFCPAPAAANSEKRSLQLLFVGRFQEQKNLSFLLEALSQLPAGTFELHMVGDGPDKESLQELAVKLGLAPLIAWHGWLPRAALRDVYQACDCLVNPSTYEGMPNAVLEAMACGLPVVASNVAGNNALVADAETGFLFEAGDGPRLRDAILKLRDSQLRSRLGQAATDRSLQFLSWKDVARQYADLFSGSANGEKG